MHLRHRSRRAEGPWHGNPALIAAPLALIALIVVLDLWTGKSIQLGPLLVVAPAITATFGSPRLVALVAALAVGAQLVLSAVLGGVTTANHEAQIGALLTISLFVVGFRYAHERHERQLGRARLVADVIQRYLLRPLPQRVGPLRVAAVYVAAEAEARMGGDLYATARTPDGNRFLIGDVRGKGLPAIGSTTLLLGAFHAAAHRNPPLARLVAHLHNTVYWDTVAPSDEPDNEEGFVTAAVLDVPDEEPVIRLISCGHPPPLLVHRGRVTPLTVRDPALPLGVGSDMEADDYEVETFPFEAGDLLLLYTDGVTESRDARGVFYPLAERVTAWRERDPQRLVQRLHDDLLHHAGGTLTDDAALVAVLRCR
ncbi:PP2C family protein-serine/threonine phosphatase [Streptomyces abikoensis]|uniref:PP2C family protein-serine/threonine phosphatase n=1 Tax=Streptomyces abikoensis TaxID=97398 RepID=UPI0033F3B5B8